MKLRDYSDSCKAAQCHPTTAPQTKCLHCVEYIRQMSAQMAETMSDVEIAKKLRVSPATVRVRRLEAGYKRQCARPRIQISEFDLIKYVSAKMSDEQIGEIMVVNASTITRRRREYGIVSLLYRPPAEYKEKVAADVIRSYDIGCTTRQICNTYKLSSPVVFRILKRAGKLNRNNKRLENLAKILAYIPTASIGDICDKFTMSPQAVRGLCYRHSVAPRSTCEFTTAQMQIADEMRARGKTCSEIALKIRRTTQSVAGYFGNKTRKAA